MVDGSTPNEILRAFAALVGRRDGREAPRTPHIPEPSEFLWLGAHESLAIRMEADAPTARELIEARSRPSVAATFVELALGSPSAPNRSVSLPDGPVTERLAKVQALLPGDEPLHEGWVWFVGRPEEAPDRTVCFPLLTRPVRVRRALGRWELLPAGTVSVTHQIAHATDRHVIEQGAQFGGGALRSLGAGDLDAQLRRLPRLTSWIRDAAKRAGLKLDDIVATGDPLALARGHGMTAVVGAAVYVMADLALPVSDDEIATWAERPDVGVTAFAALYAEPSTPRTLDVEPVDSVVPLDRAQRRAVRAARHDRITVVSGPPGDGKSHTTVAVALDAVEAGHSVLVLTRRRAARDVLADLFAATPGPRPIMFGTTNSAETLEALERINEQAADPTESDRLRERLHRSADRRDAERRHLVELLETESAAGADDDPAEWELRRAHPTLWTTPAATLEQLLDQSDARPRFRWGRRRARAELARLADRPDGPIDEVRRAAEIAVTHHHRVALSLAGGVRLDAAWSRWLEADSTYRAARAAWLGLELRQRTSSAGPRRTAAADLARALRSGRARRRDFLGGVDPGPLLGAAPLWLGTLDELDDVLPPTSAMFDLVVVDEASQVDQLRAATGLLRARRAVVVGDPRQLRHTSFLSDARQLEVLGDQAAMGGGAIDVRRDSLYDAAARQHPVVLLDQHHRSTPHLIGFSLTRFYRDEVTLMTRHPRNDATDDIDVVTVDGATPEARRDAERRAALDQIVAWHRDDPNATFGIVVPPADDADTMRELVMDRFDAEVIERMRLQVGSVHQFQGAERDRMVAVLGIDDDDAARRRFVADAHTLNVMITRARERLCLVTALATDGDDLLGDFLAWSRRPPTPPTPDGQAAPGWARGLAERLTDAGHAACCGYPVGPWTVDLVVGTGDTAVAVECGVHLDGTDAHIERRQALVDAGWTVMDWFPSRFDHDAARAAAELATALT